MCCEAGSRREGQLQCTCGEVLTWVPPCTRPAWRFGIDRPTPGGRARISSHSIIGTIVNARGNRYAAVGPVDCRDCRLALKRSIPQIFRVIREMGARSGARSACSGRTARQWSQRPRQGLGLASRDKALIQRATSPSPSGTNPPSSRCHSATSLSTEST